MFARMVRYRIDPDRCDEAAATFREALGNIAQLDGFEDGHVLIDSENGEVATLTYWSSRQAMDASEVRAASLRQSALRGVDGGVESVIRYDVTIDLERAT